MMRGVVLLVAVCHAAPIDLSWSYGTNAATWSNQFPLCGGPNQSPVALGCAAQPLPLSDGISLKGAECTEPVQAGGEGSSGYALEFQYDTCGAQNSKGASVVTLDSKNFVLQGLHFNHPAEHVVEGRRYDAECHLIHRAADNQTLVVSVLFSVGDKDHPFLHKLLSAGSASTMSVNPYRELLPQGSAQYVYPGSLTAPPCSPAVVVVLAQPVEMSVSQLRQLQTIIQGMPQSSGTQENARPLQMLGDRVVNVFAEQAKPQLDAQQMPTQPPTQPASGGIAMVPYMFATDSGGGYGGAPIPMDHPHFQNPLTNPWWTVQLGQMPYFL